MLIPLGFGASRGDQLQNAALFERAGCSAVLHEQDATVETLLASIEKVWAQQALPSAISGQQAGDGTEKIIELIDTVTGEKSLGAYQKRMILGKGLCDNYWSWSVASGLSISHRFISAVLKAPPKQQASKMMIERQTSACALH